MLTSCATNRALTSELSASFLLQITQQQLMMAQQGMMPQWSMQHPMAAAANMTAVKRIFSRVYVKQVSMFVRLA